MGWMWYKRKDGEEKHIAFSGDVDWCVKYKEEFDMYEPPYFMFIDKVNGDYFALYEPKSLQFKDKRDEPISKEEYKKIEDIALPLLQKYNPEIVNGDKEYMVAYSICNKIFGEGDHFDIGDVFYLFDFDINSYTSDGAYGICR